MPVGSSNRRCKEGPCGTGVQDGRMARQALRSRRARIGHGHKLNFGYVGQSPYTAACACLSFQSPRLSTQYSLDEHCHAYLPRSSSRSLYHLFYFNLESRSRNHPNDYTDRSLLGPRGCHRGCWPDRCSRHQEGSEFTATNTATATATNPTNPTAHNGSIATL